MAPFPVRDARALARPRRPCRQLPATVRLGFWSGGVCVASGDTGQTGIQIMLRVRP